MADIEALYNAVLRMIDDRSEYANERTINQAERDFNFDEYVDRLEVLLGFNNDES